MAGCVHFWLGGLSGLLGRAKLGACAALGVVIVVRQLQRFAQFVEWGQRHQDLFFQDRPKLRDGGLKGGRVMGLP